jgi:hypothetical protein
MLSRAQESQRRQFDLCGESVVLSPVMVRRQPCSQKEDLIIPHVSVELRFRQSDSYSWAYSTIPSTSKPYPLFPLTVSSSHSFIVSKARGKSGPLFHFDAHEDVRLLHDATKEKDESHAGKVVERSWYNRNKHVFPQNRWEGASQTLLSGFKLIIGAEYVKDSRWLLKGLQCRSLLAQRIMERIESEDKLPLVTTNIVASLGELDHCIRTRTRLLSEGHRVLTDNPPGANGLRIETRRDRPVGLASH